MKKVLYISNIEVPYRANFFAQLAERTDLTVLYEKNSSEDRDKTWSASGSSDYKREWLARNPEDSLLSSLRRLRTILRRDWDVVIIGCYNTPLQIIAARMLTLMRRKFIINFDGETFVSPGIKGFLKKLAMTGATGYLTAGEHSAQTLRKAIGGSRPIGTYRFSSMTEQALAEAAAEERKRGEEILVVGRYRHYKGLDIAMEVARRCPDLRFTFIGTADSTQQFKADMAPLPANTEIIPFLQTKELTEHYRTCSIFLLPTRFECWGLVINEAAACGTPIVTTSGSGAALDLLGHDYPQFLARPDSAEALEKALRLCLASDREAYSRFLRKRNSQYSIEKSVDDHVSFINRICADT